MLTTAPPTTTLIRWPDIDGQADERIAARLPVPVARSDEPQPGQPGHLQHLLVSAIRTIQQLLGHSDVDTTMIYTHVLPATQGGQGVRSPLDTLA